MSDVSVLLSKAEASWKKSKELAKTITEKIPEGEYLLKFVKASMSLSAKGNVVIKRHHVVTEGDLKGSPAYDNLVAVPDSDIGFAYVIAWLDVVGAKTPDDPKDLEKILEKLEYTAKGVISHQKDSDFIKVNILEAADGSSKEEDSSDEEEVDLEKMDRKELKALILEKELDVEVTSKMDDDDIRKAIEKAVESAGDTDGEDNEKKEEESVTDLDEMNRKELKEFIAEQELDIMVTDKMDDNDIRQAIADAVNDSEDETKGDEDEDLIAAREFAKSHDIEFEDDDVLKDILKKIKKETFKEKKLDKDEIKFLKANDLEDCIK